MNNIGDKIQVFRKSANLTQKELGERIGVSYQQISQYEHGIRNPKYETLVKIASTLNIDIKEFIEPTYTIQSFYHRFSILCSQINLSPTAAIKKIGLSTGNLKNWKCGRIPSTDVLCKIAHFFNVPVDHLLNSATDNITEAMFSEKEIQLILAYRKHPQMQAAVDKLLNI